MRQLMMSVRGGLPTSPRNQAKRPRNDKNTTTGSNEVVVRAGSVLDSYAAMRKALSSSLNIGTLEHIDNAMTASAALVSRGTRYVEQAGPGLPDSAAVTFAKQVIRYQGQIADADIDDVRTLGFTDPQIVAIIAALAVNVMMNALTRLESIERDLPDKRGEASS